MVLAPPRVPCEFDAAIVGHGIVDTQSHPHWTSSTKSRCDVLGRGFLIAYHTALHQRLRRVVSCRVMSSSF